MNYLKWNQASLKQTIKDFLLRIKIAQPLGGYPLNRNEFIKSFFIIGSGRCGTTLLRKILFSHPDICIPPETYVLHKCIKLYRVHNNLQWNNLVNLVLSTLEYHPKFTAFDLSLRPLAEELIHRDDSERSLALILDRFYHFYADEKEISCVLWGDKTPKNTLHLGLIDSVFPDAKYIHLIRHGADVVHSYLTTGLRTDLIYTAKQWEKAVRLAQTFGAKHPAQYFEVRYENLVNAPEKITRDICDFLDIEYLDEMIQDSEMINKKMGDVPMYKHFSSVMNPITTETIGKGIRSLSNQQIETLRETIGSCLEDLGYEL